MICGNALSFSGFTEQFATMNMTDGAQLWALFFASLALSPHCLLMCGSCVSSCQSLRPPSSQWIYNLSRIGMYMFVGGCIAEARAFLGPDLGHKWQIAAVCGLFTYGLFKLFSTWKERRSVRSQFQMSKESNLSCCQIGHKKWPILMGLLSIIMPCMTLLPALVVASFQSDFIKGAMVMFIFGLGTLPVMIGSGNMLRILWLKIPRPWMQLFHPLCCLVIALVSLHGLS